MPTPTGKATKKEKVWAKTCGRCWYCGMYMHRDKDLSGYQQTVTVDQFVTDRFIHPKEGGTKHINNLIPVCRSCLCRKRGKTVEEFRIWLSHRNHPHFVAAQMEYLVKIGIEMGLPTGFPCHNCIPVLFWFEKQYTNGYIANGKEY